MKLAKSKVKINEVMEHFGALWASLFQTSIHLDSALSKQPIHIKSVLAQILPMILLRPVSLARSLGIGIPPNEPWGLSKEELAQWKPARLLAERLVRDLDSDSLFSLPATEDDFPPELITQWRSEWGEALKEKWVQVLSRPAPLSLRVTRKGSVSDLLEEFKPLVSKQNSLIRSDLVPTGMRFSTYESVLRTSAYQQGKFEIQDEGSQLMSQFSLWPDQYSHQLSSTPSPAASFSEGNCKDLPRSEGKSVIDACAGAGGKTLALADAMRGKGRIYSYDVSEKKLAALRRRATRAGLNNIQTLFLREGNELEQIGKFKSKADIVLVDAPCSGWGVLRRNPDIKWRPGISPQVKMEEIQFRLLSLYSELVRPSGRLVYGVCTFGASETLGTVGRFLKANPSFVAEQGGYLGPDPSDGFYMQSFRRVCH